MIMSNNMDSTTQTLKRFGKIGYCLLNKKKVIVYEFQNEKEESPIKKMNVLNISTLTFEDKFRSLSISTSEGISMGLESKDNQDLRDFLSAFNNDLIAVYQKNSASKIVE